MEGYGIRDLMYHAAESPYGFPCFPLPGKRHGDPYMGIDIQRVFTESFLVLFPFGDGVSAGNMKKVEEVAGFVLTGGYSMARRHSRAAFSISPAAAYDTPSSRMKVWIVGVFPAPLDQLAYKSACSFFCLTETGLPTAGFISSFVVRGFAGVFFGIVLLSTSAAFFFDETAPALFSTPGFLMAFFINKIFLKILCFSFIKADITN